MPRNDEKWCYGCKTNKPAKKSFHKDRSTVDGFNKLCKECGREAAKRRYREMKAGVTLEAFFMLRVRNIKARSKKSGIPCNLTPGYLHSMYENQQGRCVYTGMTMVLTNSSSDTDSLSVDRIDPNKGYVEGNVVLCTLFANFLKGARPQAEFLARLHESVTSILAHLDNVQI